MYIYVYIYIYIYIYIPICTLHYENLPELPPGFLHPHPFPNTPIIKGKRIPIFCGKITL